MLCYRRDRRRCRPRRCRRRRVAACGRPARLKRAAMLVPAAEAGRRHCANVLLIGGVVLCC